MLKSVVECFVFRAILHRTESFTRTTRDAVAVLSAAA